jgi:hypothetical protein
MARITFEDEIGSWGRFQKRFQVSDPAVAACQCCAWVLTGITGGTAVYTACLYTDRLFLQALAALFAIAMTVLLVVFSAEAPRQPAAYQALLWTAVAVLMAISVWGTARAIQETIPLDRLRVTGTPEQQWHGMLAFGLLLDLLRALSVWTAAAIKSRKQSEAEEEERKHHQKQLRRAQETALFPLPKAEASPLFPLSEAEAAPAPAPAPDILKEHFQPGDAVSIRLIQDRLSLGFQKARALKDAAICVGLLNESGKGLVMTTETEEIVQ